ncbi:hypothetical protein STVA_06950 [Allostella vacuolata]|nr:hypothetical protein STVA_06950 [Stella vacuolata]
MPPFLAAFCLAGFVGCLYVAGYHGLGMAWDDRGTTERRLFGYGLLWCGLSWAAFFLLFGLGNMQLAMFGLQAAQP